MQRLKIAIVLAGLVLNSFGLLVAAEAPSSAIHWLPVTPGKLPRWRGFNLLEKFQLQNGRQPFREEDFKWIAQWGFNFVRLPMDYRLWIKNGDWEQFDEGTLDEIDQAIKWGGQYGIHVCLNFHRAPGYTVARPPEKTILWTDPEAQRVCALHWAVFAKRYKGIPNERLSFNLMNEPGDISAKTYAEVVEKLVKAIRKEDPERLIIADGVEWGQKPVLELARLGVAQATRGYTPMELTHYKASWVNSGSFPCPAWPRTISAAGCLLGPAKKEGSFPLVINGPFVEATVLRLHVMTISTEAKLVVSADGKTIWQKTFTCGPGAGEWKKSEFKPQWKVYQNLFDKDYTLSIPAGASQAQIRVAEGDWLQISELGFRRASTSKEDCLPLDTTYGKKPLPFRYNPGSSGLLFENLQYQDRAWLWAHCIAPWKEAEARGVGVMVGEWGSFNFTPHEVVLRWSEDCLANWQQAGWGWAMWNFRGAFGILDSERSDVVYEDFAGHKLDRKLLELLQRY